MKLTFDPKIALTLGLNESIFISQLQYWESKSTFSKEGRRWVYNTVRMWAEQFPFWSEATLKRVIYHLEQEGVLLSRAFSTGVKVRTKWYAIDHDALNKKIGGKKVPTLQENLISLKEATARDKAKLKAKPMTVARLQKLWSVLLSEAGYGKALLFTKKEAGMAKNLIARLGSDQAVFEFIEFTVTQWPRLVKEITWGNGKTRLSKLPTFMDAFACKEDILALMGKPPASVKKVRVFTNPQEVPMDYPNREMILRMLRINREVVVEE